MTFRWVRVRSQSGSGANRNTPAQQTRGGAKEKDISPPVRTPRNPERLRAPHRIATEVIHAELSFYSLGQQEHILASPTKKTAHRRLITGLEIHNLPLQLLCLVNTE